MKTKLQKIADKIKSGKTEGYCTDTWRFAQSRLYKVGQTVYAAGYGWGAKGNWHRKFGFICSLRTKRGNQGGYLVFTDKGKTAMLTNIGAIPYGERLIEEGRF
jgi:hypothetical protein